MRIVKEPIELRIGTQDVVRNVPGRGLEIEQRRFEYQVLRVMRCLGPFTEAEIEQ
jgi:hypothetical protein